MVTSAIHKVRAKLDKTWLATRLKQINYSGRPMTGQRTELMNRAVLGIIVDAWKRYPSEVTLPEVGTYDKQLLGQVLGLLAQEQVLHVTDTSVALTDSGYAAVEQAGRIDDCLSAVLHDGSLPAEGSGSSSLLLAILRATFERRNRPNV